jgi:hypothetical protein
VRQIVAMAFRHAGQLELTQMPSTAQAAAGRDILETIIDALAMEGVSARATQFVTLTLVPGTNVYTLGSETLDVLDPGKYIDPASPDSETPVMVISREEWQLISSRAAEGRPSQMYVHKEFSLLQLFMWPTPDVAGSSIRLLTGRRLADCDDDNATMDLETFWVMYLVTALAARIAEASSVGNEKILRIKMEAFDLLKKARARSTQQLDTQISVQHDVGWNRG